MVVSYRKLVYLFKMGCDRYKLLKCFWCEKEFRSDYVKKYQEKCKKKNDKENMGLKLKKKKNNRFLFGCSFIDNEVVNLDSDNDMEIVVEEIQEDWNFIDDEYYLEDNFEEVRIRFV